MVKKRARMAVHSMKPNAIKKPYTVPCLVVYGTIISITRANASGSKTDHDMGPLKTN
jgi:hypothetical protein